MNHTDFLPEQLEKYNKIRPRFLTIQRICNKIQNETRLPGRRRFAKLISSFFLPPIDEKSVICPTIYSFDLCVSRSTGSQYYYYGCYEPGTIHVMQHCLASGDVFIDVGASVGQMTFFASKLVGEDGIILAFEPHDLRYSQLLNGIALNNFSNIKPFKMGLGKEKCEIKLYTDVVSPSMTNITGGSKYQISTIDCLDDILVKQNISKVRMMKIDVEGFEGDVLQGANKLLSSEKPPILCVEHSIYKNKFNVLDYIQKINNYKCFQLERTKKYASNLNPIKDIKKLEFNDNIFCFLPSHIEELRPTRLFSKY